MISLLKSRISRTRKSAKQKPKSVSLYLKTLMFCTNAKTQPNNGMLFVIYSVKKTNWFLWFVQYQQMEALGVGDSAQVHAAFLVYMDLAEGELMFDSQSWYLMVVFLSSRVWIAA